MLVFLSVTAVAAFVTDLHAETVFEGKYRAYQAEVKAAKASLDKKEYQPAVEHYSRAIEMSPFEASHYFNRGIARYKTGKYKEAISDFDNALLLDPRLVESYGYRGLCRERMGEYLEALKDYTVAGWFSLTDTAVSVASEWVNTWRHSRTIPSALP